MHRKSRHSRCLGTFNSQKYLVENFYSQNDSWIEKVPRHNNMNIYTWMNLIFARSKAATQFKKTDLVYCIYAPRGCNNVICPQHHLFACLSEAWFGSNKISEQFNSSVDRHGRKNKCSAYQMENRRYYIIAALFRAAHCLDCGSSRFCSVQR